MVTTYVYADLRYDDKTVLSILGDRKMLAETPLIQQFINEGKLEGKIEGKIEAIYTVIESRFGSVPEGLSAKLAQIRDLDRLSDLLRLCSVCETVEAIERELE